MLPSTYYLWFFGLEAAGAVGIVALCLVLEVLTNGLEAFRSSQD